MSKKTGRQKAIKKADDAMSQYIRKRDKYCITCGSPANLTNSHLITRSKHATRWVELNCHCQCRGCNYRHEFQPEIYTTWFLNKYGEKQYAELVLESNTIKKYTVQAIEDIARHYKEKADAL